MVWNVPAGPYPEQSCWRYENSGGDIQIQLPKGAPTYFQEIVKEFETKNGSVVCKDLKGLETKKVLRSCDGCIEDAARIAEKILGL